MIEPAKEVELRPSVRLSATYPATDGSAPELIEIVWEIYAPGAEDIARLIAALASVTRGVDYWTGPSSHSRVGDPSRPYRSPL